VSLSPTEALGAEGWKRAGIRPPENEPFFPDATGIEVEQELQRILGAIGESPDFHSLVGPIQMEDK
jgi:hypothetical protein